MTSSSLLKIRENTQKLFNRHSSPRIQSEPQNDQMCVPGRGGREGSLGDLVSLLLHKT